MVFYGLKNLTDIIYVFIDARPRLLYSFIDQTLQPGPWVSLKCSADGSPTPEIKWTVNGFNLPMNERLVKYE